MSQGTLRRRRRQEPKPRASVKKFLARPLPSIHLDKASPHAGHDGFNARANTQF
jgi:hypothetical protein